MSRRSLVYSSLVATTLIWGGSFVAIKQALHYVNPLELVILRFVPSSLAFAVLLCVRHGPSVGKLLSTEWRPLCAMGLFGVIMYHLALNFGEQSVSAGTASLIMALNPAFIFVLSVIGLGERASLARMMGLSIAFLGLVIVVRFASGAELSLGYVRGVLLTLLAPLAWAFYTVLSRPLVSRHPPLAVTGLATILGTLPMLGLARPSLAQTVSAMPWDGWASVLFLGLLCTVGGVTVWVAAVQQLGTSGAGAFIYLVPLWSALLSQLLLGEPLTPPLFVGAGVIIAGVAIVNRT